MAHRIACRRWAESNMASLLSLIDVRVPLNPAAALVGASVLAAAML